MLFKKNRKYLRGITLVEMLIVLAVISILVAIGLSGFNNLNSKQAVDKAALLALSVLDEARSQTLAAKNSTQYGVHFETTQIVLFTGGTYSAGNSSNQVNDLGGKVSVSSINISGGTDVIFDRLTGTTVNTGNVVVSLNQDNSVQKTITIYPTGVAQSN